MAVGSGKRPYGAGLASCMTALNDAGSGSDSMTIEEQLEVQELLERERAAEFAMQNRLRGCKWLKLDQSLWGEQWSRARLESDPDSIESLFVPPIAADGNESCPVCLYPPLQEQRVVLDCCKTSVCQVTYAPPGSAFVDFLFEPHANGGGGGDDDDDDVRRNVSRG